MIGSHRSKRQQLVIGFSTLSAIALLAGGFATSDAWAGRPERVGAASAGIKRLDTNGDGRLSREEHAAAARKVFEGMDQNHDGKVTVAEMDAAHARVKDRRPSRSMKAANLSSADKIKLDDRDGDGMLSVEEHTTAAIVTFDKMDPDHDGQLTSTELAAGHSKVQRKPRGK
jgi:hypothetical protein